MSERDQAMTESSKGSSTEQMRLNQLMQERDSLLAQQQALQTDNDRVSSGLISMYWSVQYKYID